MLGAEVRVEAKRTIVTMPSRALSEAILLNDIEGAEFDLIDEDTSKAFGASTTAIGFSECFFRRD